MTTRLAPTGNPYPPIEAVADHGARPFWSIMIPVYNCAEYLRVTLASVLAQFPPEDDAQIEVIDDCSTRDDPAAVVGGVRRPASHVLPSASQRRGASHVHDVYPALPRRVGAHTARRRFRRDRVLSNPADGGEGVPGDRSGLLPYDEC